MSNGSQTIDEALVAAWRPGSALNDVAYGPEMDRLWTIVGRETKLQVSRRELWLRLIDLSETGRIMAG